MESREGAEDDHGHGEGGEQHTGANDRHERLRVGRVSASRSVQHKAEQREGGCEQIRSTAVPVIRP